MKEKSYALNLLLITCAVILLPHKNVLMAIKWVYRGLAVAISGFLSIELAPLVPDALSEIMQGSIPLPVVIFTVSYLILIYAASLMFWQVADNCTIQLKNRFNIEP